MAKISCGLSIDMLAPYIEDVLVDNPIIGGEDGIPITEVYRQTLMDVEDLFDNFRVSLRNIAEGKQTDYSDLITLLIPGNITLQHAIKANKDESFELEGKISTKAYKENMQKAIQLLVQEWDEEVEEVGTPGKSQKEDGLGQEEMPDGDSPVGNVDVPEPVKRVETISQGFSNIFKKKRRSIDQIIRESLGDELIDKAPKMVEMLKDIIGHSVADTRIDGDIKFTMNKRKIRNEIKNKIKEAVTVYYEENAIAIATRPAIGKVSELENNVLILDRAQLPDNIQDVLVEEDFSVYSSDSIVDKYGKSKMLVVGDSTALDLSDVIAVSSTNNPLNRDIAIKSDNSAILNAYLANVLLSNFDSMVDNIVPFLRETFREKFRIGSVDITDSMSGNQAKAIIKANITTTPKLAAPEKGNLAETVKRLKSSISDRGTKTIEEVLNESEIIDSVMGDRPLLRVRMNDSEFEDIVVLKLNNKRYPLVLDRKNKTWSIIQNINPATGIQSTTSEEDINFIEEYPLISLMNDIFKVDGIKEAKNVFGLPNEVNVGSVFVGLNDISRSLLESKAGLDIMSESSNSYNKFLAEEELEALSEIFLNLPHDIKEAGLELKSKLNDSYGAEAEILRGMYYRFFNPDEYFITRRNPITGKTETQKHNSFYRISKLGLGKASRQANEQLIALKSLLNTVAPNEFINMINGSAVMSNTLNGDTLKNNLESIDYKNTVRDGETFFTNDLNLRHFKVKQTTTSGVLEITFKPGKNERVFTIDTNSSSIGGRSFTKFPFTIKDDGGLRFKDFEDMLRVLQLPTKFATQDFLSITGESGKEISDIKNFITTIVGLKLANGNGKNFRKSNASLLTKELSNSNKPNSPQYNTSQHLPADFKDYLKSILDKFEGLSVRKFVTDHERNKRMTTATVNKNLRMKQVIKEAIKNGLANMYRDGAFITGKLTVDGTYSKNGIIEGIEGKSNGALSTREQFKFLVESSFLSTAEQKNYTQAAFQSSTKSDRNTVAMNLIGRSEGESFLPKTQDDRLDRESLINDVVESQNNFYSAMERKVVDEWVGSGTKFGKGLLKRMYDTDVKITNVDGDPVIIKKDMINPDMTLRQLNVLLNELRLDFDDVKHIGGIISNLGYSKGPGGIAVIRNSTIRMSEIMQDKTSAAEFLERNRLMFIRSANKLFGGSYTPSDNALDIIETRFGEMPYKDAKNTILDAFFYNDILISNEMIRFETGPIEQYSVKYKKEGIEKELFPELSFFHEIEGKPAKDIIKYFKEKLNKYSYQELAENTRLGLFKKVIEDQIMTPTQKVQILEFDDISSQLSPAYIDQVKRNQGVGTSLQMFTKASNTEGGTLVGESTKCVTIDDPTFNLHILGFAGMSEVDSYDATTIMHPIEMIKYNNSLGNRMSNFSSKGGAFKDVNVSSTPEGYYVYQKKASQPLFGTEFLINASPEHVGLIRKINKQISFNNTQLWVENVNNETGEESSSQISFNDIAYYGESLGRLKTAQGDFVDAGVLLFKLNNNEINEVEIEALGLSTNKILKTFDNIQELWDHFGGLEGDYNRLKTEPEENIKYTFGYGMHKAADVISNFRGPEGNYPLRDAYIGKIGVASQEKTGSRSINPASSLINNTELEYETVPNSDSGIILQPDHDPDTTASMSNKKENEHDSDIKVITQILSAAVGEGEGFDNVREILTTVGSIVDMEMDEFVAEIDEFSEKYRNNITDRKVPDNEAKQAGYLSVAYNLTKSTLQTRNDPGVTGSMIFENDPNDVNFDHKAILPILRTAVNSELNKRVVNLRFKGNQTVVTASHDQVKSYRFGSTTGLYRSTVNKIADEYIEQDLSLPEGWELNPVNALDNLSDTDYVYEVKDDGTRVRTTFGKFRQIKNLGNRVFKSVFSPVNEGIKSGEILKWFNYRAADGSGNLVDTLEYKRYMNANDFYLFVKAGNLEESLVRYPEFDETHIQSIVESELSAREFIKESAKDLHDVLQQPGKWVTDEAEFYVPPMHQAAFLIDDYDTLHDIIGVGEQPDTKALLTLGLINSKEFEVLERKYSSSEAREIINRLQEEGNPLVQKFIIAKEEQIAAMESYFGGSASSEGKVEKEISEIKRLLSLESVGKLRKTSDTKRLSALLSNHPILGLLKDRSSREKSLERIDKIIKINTKISGLQFKLLTDLKQQLSSAETSEDVNSLIDRSINKYKNFWVQTLVDNFPYTLSFISARIPASGKQSYVAAKVKNFIFSTRNASYGPLELIGISGADYDIDKQNNLTWDVDIYGKVFDWLDYEDANGKLLPTKTIKAMIDAEVSEHEQSLVGLDLDEQSIRETIASFRKSKIDEMSRRLQNRVVRGLITNITDPKNAIEAATGVAMNKLKGIKRKLAEYNYGTIDDTYLLDRAFKNDPEISGLIKDLEKSGNVSADLKNIKKALDKDQLQKYANSALQLLVEPRKHALPLSSITKMTYERVNLDGKTGIGIFASALKGYFASYYAWVGNKGLVEYRRIIDNMRDSGELAQFPSIAEANEEAMRRMGEADRTELERLSFRTSYIKRNDKGNIDAKNSVLNREDVSTLGDDFNEDALQIVSRSEDGSFKIKNITTIANTGKWIVNGYAATSRAREAAELVRNAASIDEQQEIVSKFTTDIGMFRDSNVDSQAWADLSELLNAATDNAKELILGYIGATNTTDAMISAMVVMGIDLNVTLGLLNDPQVSRVIRKIEDSDYLFNTKTSEFMVTLGKELSSASKRYEFDVEKFKEDHSDLSEKELEKQLVLAKLYNPAKQLSIFSKVGEELTSLSSSFLSINQGLPNSEYDVFNFIRKANKALQNGTFEEFVDSEEKREEMIDSFEKVGLNVPYIIANNPHYFGQFRALNLTNEIVNSVSFISGLVRNDLLEHSGKRIEMREFREHTNNVYGLIVDSFYNDPSNNNVKLTIGGRNFDLSESSLEGDTGGRLELIKHIPDVVADAQNDKLLSDNVFVKKVFINTAAQDRETGEQLAFVNGPSTALMTPEEISILRANANKLKVDNPELYNALFNYSLIVDRGGLSRGSLSQFFTNDDFSQFNNYVKNGEVEKKLLRLFGPGMSSELRQLLTPTLIESVSSSSDYYAAKNKLSEEEIEDVDPEQHDLNEKLSNIERKMHSHKTSWLNKKRREVNKKYDNGKVENPFPNVVRIKETGTVMAWNEPLQSYLPIVKSKPNVSIPISIEGVESNNSVFDITQFGFEYGWEVNTTSNFKSGETGRIIRKTIGKRNHYDVLVNGQIKQFRANELKNFNPGIILKDYKIDISRVGKSVSDRVLYYNIVSGNVSILNKRGSYSPIDVDESLEYLYDSTDKTIFSQDFANLVKKKVGKNVDKNYVAENFEKLPVVKNFRRALVTSVHRLDEASDNLLTIKQVEQLKGIRASAIRNKFDDLTSLQKIELMRGGVESWEDFVKELIADSSYSWGISNSEFDIKKIPGKFTQLELSYITDPKLATTITISQTLSLIKDYIKDNEEVYFDKALKGLGEKRVAYAKHNGDVINGKRFIPESITNPNVHKSVEYDVPPSLNEFGNKLIGAKSLKRIAKVFNGKFFTTRTHVLNSEEIHSKYGEKYSNLKGFVINGNIILNQDKASISTPIHELGHVYLAHLKENDTKLYDYIVSESLGSSIAQRISDAYPELSSNDVGEEVFVEMLGIEFGKDLASIAKSNVSWNNIKRRLSNNKAFGKVTDFFRTVVSWFTGKEVSKDVDFGLNDSLSTVLNDIGNNILYNEDSIFSDFSNQERAALQLTNPTGKMSPELIERILKQKGYIRRICP